MKTYFAHGSHNGGISIALTRFEIQTLTESITISSEAKGSVPISSTYLGQYAVESVQVQGKLYRQFGKLTSDNVAKGNWPADASTYILLSTKNNGALYGKANTGWVYGYGVCSCDVAKRISINWYEFNKNLEDDLLTSLVNSCLCITFTIPNHKLTFISDCCA